MQIMEKIKLLFGVPGKFKLSRTPINSDKEPLKGMSCTFRGSMTIYKGSFNSTALESK